MIYFLEERESSACIHSTAWSIFQKAINFVCHSYNLTDFSLWLMMAIVEIYVTINSLSQALLIHFLYPTRNSFSLFSSQSSTREKISINFGSFLSFFFFVRLARHKASCKRIQCWEYYIIQYSFFILMLYIAAERRNRKREIFKSCSINHNVTLYISPNITEIQIQLEIL
jgi:hypothetical protein